MKAIGDLDGIRSALPDTGAFDLRARVKQEGRLYRLEDFELGLGETRIAGFVEVDARGDKPRLTGDFQVPLGAISRLVKGFSTTGRASDSARAGPYHICAIRKPHPMSAGQFMGIAGGTGNSNGKSAGW